MLDLQSLRELFSVGKCWFTLWWEIDGGNMIYGKI